MHQFRIFPKLQDFASFEALFVLFMFAGTFKSAPVISSINERIDVTLLLVALGWFFGAFVFLRERRWPSGLARQYGYLLMLFFGYEIFLYAIGENHERANSTVMRIIGMSTWAVVAPLFVINSEVRVQRLLRLTFIYITLLGLNSLVITKGADPTEAGAARAGTFGAVEGDNGSYGEAGRLAADGIAIVAVALLRTNLILDKVLLFADAGSLAMMLKLSGARQAILGLMVVIAYLISFLSMRRGGAWQFLRLISVVGILAIGYMGFQAIVYQDRALSGQADRLTSIFSSEGSSGGVLEASQRSSLWSAGLELWAKSPLIGSGLGAMRTIHPHNFFIEMLCDGGIIGFLIGGLVMAVPFFLIARSVFRSASPDFVLLSTLWLNHFSYSMVSGDVGQNRIVYTFSALIVSYYATALQQVEAEHEVQRVTFPTARPESLSAGGSSREYSL